MPIRISPCGLATSFLIAVVLATPLSSSARASDACAESLKSGIAQAEAALASKSSDAEHQALSCLLTSLKGLEARLATIESDIGAPPRLIVPHTQARSPGSSDRIIVRGRK